MKVSNKEESSLELPTFHVATLPPQLLRLPTRPTPKPNLYLHCKSLSESGYVVGGEKLMLELKLGKHECRVQPRPLYKEQYGITKKNSKTTKRAIKRRILIRENYQLDRLLYALIKDTDI